MQKAISFNDAAVVFVKGIDHRIHIWYITKYEAISILTDANLKEKDHYVQNRKKKTKKKQNIMKITKKHCKNKYEKPTENYVTKKKK